MDGLPGIEVLFREHRRLANKLTKDEMKALRSYLNDRLIQEHGEVVFQLDNLKTSYSAKVYKLEEKVSEIEKELRFKTELLNQYKSSDSSLAMVHKQREKRLEHRQSFLLLDLEKGQDVIKDLQTQKDVLESDLKRKDKMIDELTLKIKGLELALVEQNYRKNQTVEDKEHKLGQDILKLKLEMDQKNKEFCKLQIEKHQLINKRNELDITLEEQTKRANNLQDSLKSKSKELAVKCEQLSMVQYELDLEKKKMADFRKDIQMREGFVSPRRGSEQDLSDVTKIRGEALRSQVQYLECRIKLLEEKIAMYRNQVRDISREITELSEDVTKSSQLKDRIFVHGTTIVEKCMRELYESIFARKIKLENSLEDILRMAPIAISKEAREIRADTLSLKKQAEVYHVNDVQVRTSRMLQRVDACDKTKFSGKFVAAPGPVIQNGNLSNTYRPKYEMRQKRDDMQERCFTIVTKKQQNGHLLSRPRQANGTSLPLWKRKHSLSVDTANCVSPALIDLNLTSGNSPSPKDKNSFFPNSQSVSVVESKRHSSDTG